MLFRWPMSKEMRFNVALVLCVLLLPLALQAEGPIKKGPVALMVRTIDAYPDKKGGGPRIDTRLKDISWKLEDLPYQTFSLESARTVKVKMKKKRVVKLPDGQELTLRMAYKNEKKLGIWIDWRDRAGMNLLNSKIHLGCSDPVLAGIDNPDGSASLLAIALAK